jgi:hypothetical protein
LIVPFLAGEEREKRKKSRSVCGDFVKAVVWRSSPARVNLPASFSIFRLPLSVNGEALLAA